MKNSTTLTTDRIGVLAYILNFFFSWSGPLAKIASPEKWKNKIQKSILELSEKSGVEIKSVKYKDSFRVLLEKDYSSKEDKVLAIFKGFEKWQVLDTKDPTLKDTIGFFQTIFKQGILSPNLNISFQDFQMISVSFQ